MMLILSISLIIPLTLMIINLLLFKKYYSARSKPSAFECGFDAIVPSRTPFSLKFYLIAIIFLIFDIEIALIMPIPIILSKSYSLSMNLMIISFMLILFIGLAVEWKEGALNWLN